jgi:hypothetical protein
MGFLTYWIKKVSYGQVQPDLSRYNPGYASDEYLHKRLEERERNSGARKKKENFKYNNHLC